jgi:ribonuclease HII
MSITITAGIDEAGRGALAGPVVAGACIFEIHDKKMPLIADSKQLNEEQREEAFEFLIEHCPYGVGIVPANVIDEIGILGATEQAMQEAVSMLGKTQMPTYLLIDGRDKFWFDIPHSSVIRGDEKEPCIAAGSIIAKVTRDRLMKHYCTEFPAFGFSKHKGYGTEDHIINLQREGICPLHRRTFLRSIQDVTSPLGAFSG